MGILRQLVSLAHRETASHTDGELRQQSVSHPSCADVRHPAHAGDLGRRGLQLLHHLGFHAVQKTRHDRRARLPDQDVDDERGDHQPHQRVQDGSAQGHTHQAGDDRQGGEAVGPGVVAVGHQGHAADAAAHPDAVLGHRLIAQKPHPCGAHGQEKESRRVSREEICHGGVSGDHRAGRDEQQDEDARRVLRPVVTVRETPGLGALAELEGDPQRDVRRGVAHIVGSVRQQGGAAAEGDDPALDRRRDQQGEEGDLDGPDPLTSRVVRSGSESVSLIRHGGVSRIPCRCIGGRGSCADQCPSRATPLSHCGQPAMRQKRAKRRSAWRKSSRRTRRHARNIRPSS